MSSHSNNLQGLQVFNLIGLKEFNSSEIEQTSLIV